MKILHKKKIVTSLPKKSWRVLVVDDEPDMHAITRLSLKGLSFQDSPIQIINASSGEEARQILEQDPSIAVACIDVVMETDDAGLRLVEHIRQKMDNDLTRLIIRTGEPGFAPERLVVDRYDIDYYAEKSNLTAQRFYTIIRTSLKAFDELKTLYQSKKKSQETVMQRTRELKASNTMLTMIMENMAESVLILDPDRWSVTMANAAAEQLFQSKKNGLIGMTLPEFFPSEKEARSALEKIETCLHQEKQCSCHDFLLRRNDESSFSASYSMTSMTSNTQKTNGFIWVIRDITERKRFEEQQQYYAFQSGVAEMSTAILHNIGNAIQSVSHYADQIHQKTDQLSYAGKMMSSVVGISEKRIETGEEPVTLLQNLLEQLAEMGRWTQDEVGKPLNEIAAKMVTSVEHIAEIVRIQQQGTVHPELNATRFSITRLLEDVIAMQKDILKKYGIEIETHVAPTVDELLLPRSQLLQMIINFVKNSQESISEKMQTVKTVHGLITVTVRPDSDDKGLLLQVVDNGIGITEDRLEKIFSSGYSTKERGTGYGLHTSALFVQSQGGKIQAFSDGENRGAMISVWLPCCWS